MIYLIMTLHKVLDRQILATGWHENVISDVAFLPTEYKPSFDGDTLIKSNGGDWFNLHIWSNAKHMHHS